MKTVTLISTKQFQSKKNKSHNIQQ